MTDKRMTALLAKNLSYFQTLFDAVPAAMLVVDHDVRVLDCNSAARALMGPDQDVHLKQLGGTALHCLHSLASKNGCGAGVACQSCVIRDAVTRAIAGDRVSRRKVRMERLVNDEVEELYLLVTSVAFLHDHDVLVLLTLEDVSELIQVQSLLPICAWCKKVRNDDNYWESVESYFKSHVDVRFTHGICDDCRKKQFPIYGLPEGHDHPIKR